MKTVRVGSIDFETSTKISSRAKNDELSLKSLDIFLTIKKISKDLSIIMDVKVKNLLEIRCLICAFQHLVLDEKADHAANTCVTGV